MRRYRPAPLVDSAGVASPSPTSAGPFVAPKPTFDSEVQCSSSPANFG
ncbi:MAG TPA: hypothetical protein VMS17_19480 [Gemmataceae bacterium]|nr:hypothetical protein [Gemmataceae bacterium]